MSFAANEWTCTLVNCRSLHQCNFAWNLNTRHCLIGPLTVYLTFSPTSFSCTLDHSQTLPALTLLKLFSSNEYDWRWWKGTQTSQISTLVFVCLQITAIEEWGQTSLSSRFGVELLRPSALWNNKNNKSLNIDNRTLSSAFPALQVLVSFREKRWGKSKVTHGMMMVTWPCVPPLLVIQQRYSWVFSWPETEHYVMTW